jgi:hypothetical protein
MQANSLAKSGSTRLQNISGALYTPFGNYATNHFMTTPLQKMKPRNELDWSHLSVASMTASGANCKNTIAPCSVNHLKIESGSLSACLKPGSAWLHQHSMMPASLTPTRMTMSGTTSDSHRLFFYFPGIAHFLRQSAGDASDPQPWRGQVCLASIRKF